MLKDVKSSCVSGYELPEQYLFLLLWAQFEVGVVPFRDAGWIV